MNRKLITALGTFLALFLLLGLTGLVVVFLFFGPHASHESEAMALLITAVCVIVPVFAALKVYKSGP